MYSRFFRTYSPQGDGNIDVVYFLSHNQHLGFSEPIPRKGTETFVDIRDEHISHNIVFQNLFPARGRKQTSGNSDCDLIGARFFRTYSPQGDGNDTLLGQINSTISGIVFQNLFPARGRKLAAFSALVIGFMNLVFQNLFPARGRKLLGLLSGVNPKMPCFSEPIPRKGTETT